MSVKFGIEQAGRDAFLAVLQFQDHVTAAAWYGTPPDPDDAPFGGGARNVGADPGDRQPQALPSGVPWACNCSATAVSVGEVRRAWSVVTPGTFAKNPGEWLSCDMRCDVTLY